MTEVRLEIVTQGRRATTQAEVQERIDAVKKSAEHASFYESALLMEVVWLLKEVQRQLPPSPLPNVTMDDIKAWSRATQHIVDREISEEVREAQRRRGAKSRRGTKKRPKHTLED